MTQTKTVKNMCTGKAVTEVLERGSNDIANRYTTRLVVPCKRDVDCGKGLIGIWTHYLPNWL